MPAQTAAWPFVLPSGLSSAPASSSPAPQLTPHPSISQPLPTHRLTHPLRQATPTFDAKGIETVRRDGCPAVVKMMEGVLRLLFATKDLSQVGGDGCRPQRVSNVVGVAKECLQCMPWLACEAWAWHGVALGNGGMAWHGMAWHGMAWHGTEWWVMPRRSCE